MPSTMPQDDFYAKVRRGMPRLTAAGYASSNAAWNASWAWATQ